MKTMTVRNKVAAGVAGTGLVLAGTLGIAAVANAATNGHDQGTEVDYVTTETGVSDDSVAREDTVAADGVQGTEVDHVTTETGASDDSVAREDTVAAGQ